MYDELRIGGEDVDVEVGSDNKASLGDIERFGGIELNGQCNLAGGRMMQSARLIHSIKYATMNGMMLLSSNTV